METSLTLQENTAQVAGKRFGIRAGAYLIDMIAFYVVNSVMTFVEGFIASLAFYMAGREYFVDRESTQLVTFLGGMLLMFLYFVIFESLYGATPGKLILGMRVIKEDGTPCGLGAALVRGLIRFIDGFFFGLVAYSIMKPPLYQRGGDQAAKTIVVGSRDAAIRERCAWWWFVIACVVYLFVAAVISTVLVLYMIK